MYCDLMGINKASQTVREMLGHLDVAVRELDKKTVMVLIRDVRSRATVATNVMEVLTTHRGLMVEATGFDTPWECLINGTPVAIWAVPAWCWAEYAELEEAVTSARLAEVTGMKINTVRSQLGLWRSAGKLTPLPEYGRFGARHWSRADVIKAIRLMPTSGNWGAGGGRKESDVSPCRL